MDGPPEDQHRLGCDRVDHIPDLLVVEQEIDELRDLDVVDRDLGLVRVCDDQVLLLCVLAELQTPRDTRRSNSR
jgi:hypothetical protein